MKNKRYAIIATTFIAIVLAVISVLAVKYKDAGVISKEESTTRFSEITYSESKALLTTKQNINTTSAATTLQTTASATTKNATATQEASAPVSATQKPTVKNTEKNTKAQSTKKATTKKTVTKKKTTKTAVAKKTTKTKKTTTTKNESIVYITIDCTKYLNNIDKLDDKNSYKIQFVPESGYIIRNYPCPYKKGETAYDIIKRTCTKFNIPIVADDNNPYGVIYISEINHLAEKDISQSSGWMYKVDNYIPMISVEKYIMQGGEHLVLWYTV